MKIQASLLRPVVDITAGVDFCVNPHLNAAVNIPPLHIDVLKVPFGLTGGLTVPELDVSQIPIQLTTGVLIFGLPIAITSVGYLGGFSAQLAGGAPIGLNMSGSLGGITATAQLREPIAMNLDGCLQGVARLNPENLQIPNCCEGYREPLCCSCQVHKDHKYCEKTCGCHIHERGPGPE